MLFQQCGFTFSYTHSCNNKEEMITMNNVTVAGRFSILSGGQGQPLLCSNIQVARETCAKTEIWFWYKDCMSVTGQGQSPLTTFSYQKR